jgi:hypothetical protein
VYVCLILLSMQSGLINSFPFDPAGMNSPDMAVKEVKNGRLAMVRTSLLQIHPGMLHWMQSPFLTHQAAWRQVLYGDIARGANHSIYMVGIAMEARLGGVDRRSNSKQALSSSMIGYVVPCTKQKLYMLVPGT